MISPVELLICAQQQEILINLDKQDCDIFITPFQITSNYLVLFRIFEILEEDYVLEINTEEDKDGR